MSKTAIAEVLPANVLEHPAVYAWSQLQPERIEPESIQLLKRKKKSTVYRLAGVGPNGSAVIAKRCGTRTAMLERMIYEELLPQLQVPTLRCYGFLEAGNQEVSWLFLEDASGQAYSSLNAEHRELAGRWLGMIHTATARISATLPAGLPDRGTSHYLAMLRSSREHLRQQLTNPGMLPDDLWLLDALAADCNVLEAHWSELEAICELIPPTLVHGDFVIKNVRLRPGPEGLQLLAFDWEYAGHGVPAADFAQFTGATISPDVSAYCAAVNWDTGKPTVAEIQRLAKCGKFFRLLDEIHWESNLLEYPFQEWISLPMSCLKVYEGRLAQALREARWS